MRRLGRKRSWLKIAALGMMIALPAAAREAAFIAPNLPGMADDGGAIKVEPKNEIDIGDSAINVARRTTLFFVNQSTLPVRVEKLAVNADSNVRADITADDCSKQGTIAPGSRCSVEVSVTPSAGGSWGVDALLTHNGAGRIARAKITGKTSGAGTENKQESGLALSSKQATPVNFDEVQVGNKAVRSALMVNDSAEPITLYSIDVVEASNGLARLEQGCALDMELKPGESCPVTLLWTPADNGNISTDLIIRHSGRLGFAVIPIRGTAMGGVPPEVGATADRNGNGTADTKNDIAVGRESKPPPPTADMLEKAMSGTFPPLAAVSVAPAAPVPFMGTTAVAHLIGTIGNRAILVLSDGSTTVVGVGDEIKIGGRETGAKVAAINARAIEIIADGKKKRLPLEMASEITSKATVAVTSEEKDKNRTESNSLVRSGNTTSVSGGNATSIPVESSDAAGTHVTGKGL